LVKDFVEILSGTHKISKIKVGGRGEELRVTIAWLDPPGAWDVPLPLLGELMLIVVSLGGRTYRGNQYSGDREEHFSTSQRVIIKPNQLEVGEYEIHVIARLMMVEELRFAVAVSGQIESAAVVFQETDKCATGCGAGVCAAGLCECPGVEFVGESCQTRVVKVESQEIVTIPEYGNCYLAIQRRENMTIFVDLVAGLFIHVFVADGNVSALPHDYNFIGYGDKDWNISVTSEGFSSPVVGLMLRNDAPKPARYRISVEVEPTPIPTEVGTPPAGYAWVVIVALSILVLIGLGFVCVVMTKRRPEIPQMDVLDDKVFVTEDKAV
jgi:hypothetical protein